MGRPEKTAGILLGRFTLIGFPVDPAHLARLLDTTVVEQPLDGSISGMLMRRDGQPVIGVNSNHPRTGQRLATAHLVGHLQMHKGRPLIICGDCRLGLTAASIPTDSEEAEANRFAMHILAPLPLVLREMRNAGAEPEQGVVAWLAARFEVGPRAMAYHLMNLGLLMDPGDLEE